MSDWLSRNSSNVWSLIGLLAAAMIVFVASRVTSFQQFGIGLLTASVALIVLMALFETVLEIVSKWLDIADDDNAPPDTQKVEPR
jgi:cell division protein FtsW (lipid II flippase)